MTDVLKVGQTAQQQDALDDDVGVFHFINGRVVFKFGQLVQPPVLVHARVQKELVDGGQLRLEGLVEKSDNFGIAFHCNSLAKQIGQADSIAEWMPCWQSASAGFSCNCCVVSWLSLGCVGCCFSGV